MTTPSSDPLWHPSAERNADSTITRFMAEIEEDFAVSLQDYWALHRWSIDNPGPFWRKVWGFAGGIGGLGTADLVDGERMPGARFFPDARLNYAENLLRRRDDAPALIFRGEDRVERTIAFSDLHAAAGRFARFLTEAGVGPGDRVAGYMPNMPETIIAMLGANWIGATWSSASPDFGVRGVLDRFGQIEPRVLVAADGYYYGGKTHDGLAKLREIRAQLPTVEHCVVVPYVSETPDLTDLPAAVAWDDVAGDAAPDGTGVPFARLPFDHPLFIMFSSGTTGAPKCIVHGQGGTLLQHLKEHRLHSDIRRDDRVFYFTTCGWMMWNWLVTALASEATVLLYDGSPFHPDGNCLFDFADAHGMTFFGTSAKYIDALKKHEYTPMRTHDLSSVRTMASTGSPLVPESFVYVYQAIKPDVHLASISGGTDIVSCFMLGVPILPVHAGEIQAPGLGMAVEVFDEDGRPVQGQKGELVCTRPFPCMPTGFWNDPDGARYRAAYFERFRGIWCHGDFVERTASGGIMVYGRSDATLNPGGVRIGTAEIYRAVEQMPEVVESVAIGQEWEGDVRVVLFVVLNEGVTLDDALSDSIRTVILQQCTPRHVPQRVVQVHQIPRTRSGKIVELAIRDVVHGRDVKNVEALSNPEALDDYRNRPELDE